MSRSSTVWHVGSEDVHLRIPLLLRLRERGFEVGAVGSQDGAKFAEHDIPYWRYPLKRWVNPFSDRGSYNRLYELFSEHKPDIVHAFDTKPALLAPMAAQRARVPGRVRTVTGMGYVFSSSSPLALSLRPVYRHLQRRASRATGVTVFQNRDDQAYFQRHNLVSKNRNALVLSSGIDVEEFLGRCPEPADTARFRQEMGLGDEPVVTMIARLVKHKGVLEYLKAASALRQRGVKASFLLAGPLASEGRQAVAAADIERYSQDVRYLGVCDNVPALLRVTDVFVLPTYYREGVPRILLEAGSLGLPLVTTDMPGCRDVVKDSENGLLIPPRDHGALAEAMKRLIQSPSLRNKMGSRAQSHIRSNFDLHGVTNAYADIYDRVITNHKSTAIDG